MFGKDAGITRVVKMGLDVKAREESGEEIREKELMPVNLIPLRDASDHQVVGAVVEEGVEIGEEENFDGSRPEEPRIIYDGKGGWDFEDEEE